MTHVLALSTELKVGGLGTPHTPPSPRRNVAQLQMPLPKGKEI